MRATRTALDLQYRYCLHEFPCTEVMYLLLLATYANCATHPVFPISFESSISAQILKAIVEVRLTIKPFRHQWRNHISKLDTGASCVLEPKYAFI